MAVKIRLKRMGKIRAPHYRIVVADSRTKRDGRVIEEIGKYHPKEEPSLIEVNSERALYWLGVGAQPSEPVLALLKISGDWQRHRGEPVPEGSLKVAEPKRDKSDLFNEALKDAHNEPKTESVTRPRKAAKSVEAPSAQTAAPETPAAETPAETPAAETPAAETPAETPAAETAAETPAAETPAETPAPETPAETPAAETPAETPAAETPATETQVDDAAIEPGSEG